MAATTLNDIANRVNNALSDAGEATWGDSVIEEWVIEGIREYSQHFPRLRTGTETTVADQHEYDLPNTCMELELVEYPTGEDPPKYLTRKSRKDPDFYGAEGYYDVAYSGTVDDLGGSYTRGSIYLSQDPESDQTITMIYWSPQAVELASNSAISIPQEHEHLLVLFAVWKAHAERLADQTANPDTTLDLLESFRKNAYQARADFDTALRTARGSKSPSGPTGPWESDTFDRIY
jgi:hypothetical protein